MKSKEKEDVRFGFVHAGALRLPPSSHPSRAIENSTHEVGSLGRLRERLSRVGERLDGEVVTEVSIGRASPGEGDVAGRPTFALGMGEGGGGMHRGKWRRGRGRAKSAGE